MEPLTWATVITLLVKYGPEVADFVVRKWNARGEVTLAEWDELQALAKKTSASQLADAIARSGLSMDDEHVKNVLAMVRK
jgi:hypothetical protein